MKRFIVYSIWFLLLILSVCEAAYGQVTADTNTPDSNTLDVVSSIAVTHTVSGGCTNPAIYADVLWNDNSTIGITSVNATAGAMAQIGESINLTDSGSALYTLRTYRRVGATGSQTVTVTFSGGNAYYAGLSVSSYCGVHQTTPEGPGGVATNWGYYSPSTVDVTATLSLLVRAAVATLASVGLVLTPDASQSNAFSFSGDFGTMGLSTKTGIGTTTMISGLDSDWYWNAIGVPINPAATTTTVVRHKPIMQ